MNASPQGLAAGLLALFAACAWADEPPEGPKADPATNAGPVVIRLKHRSGEGGDPCKAAASGKGCRVASHIQFLLGERQFESVESLREALEVVVAAEGEDGGRSARRVRIEPAGPIPYDALRSTLEACHGAGFLRVDHGFEPLPSRGEERPPSDAQALELGHLIAEQIGNQEFQALDAAYDPSALLDRAIGTTLVSTVVRDCLLTVVPSGDSLHLMLLMGDPPPRGYTLLGVRSREGTPRLVFRVIRQNGVDYHEFVLGLDEEDRPRVVDMFIASNGELLSESFRSALLPDRVSLQVLNMLLMPTPGDFAVEVEARPLYRLGELFREGKCQEVVDTFDRESAALSKMKRAHLLRITAAGRIDAALHAKAIEEMRKAFPGDPSTDLASHATLSAHGDHDAAIAAIDRLDRAIGGDPYLLLLRARAQLLAGRPDEAQASAARAVEAEPTIHDGWWTYVTVALHRKDFAATAHGLKEAERLLGAVFDDLTDDPAFAEFIQSPDYAAWKRRRDAR